MTNQLEVRDFEYFLVLAETLHYRKAAEKLHITQSALSQKISRLENLLGKPLFVRTNRKVSLSQAGELFQKESEIILGQVRRSLERWEAGVEGRLGLLRIGFVGSAMQVFLPPKIKAFSQTYPDIRFFLDDLTNQEQLDLLEKNQLDIGFIRSAHVPAAMHIRPVYKEPFLLVLPKNHPINPTSFQDMGQLAEESFVLFPNEKSQMYYQKILDICARSGFQPQISHRSIHGPTIFKLVEHGLGISIVPSSLRDDQNYQIKFIELTNIPERTELFAVWNDSHDSSALSLFLKFLFKGQST